MFNIELRYFVQDTSLDFAKDCRDLKLLEQYELDVLVSAYKCEIDPSDIEEAYQGQWDSDESFVQDLLEDTGTIPANLPWYVEIDWERTAFHVMLDYIEDSGYYFRIL